MIGQSFFRKYSLTTVSLAFLIALIGAINLASASQATRPNLYLLQLAWLLISVLAAAAVVRIPTHIIEFLTYPLYFFVNGLLVLVLVAGITVKGAQRWLDLGFFRLQPSELAKLVIILVVARYFSRFRMAGGYTLRALLRPFNISRPVAVAFLLGARWYSLPEGSLPLGSWVFTGLIGLVVLAWLIISAILLVRSGLDHQRIIAPIDIVLVPFFLIVIEPDLGTSLIVLSIALVQILFCGVRRGSLVIAALLGVGLVLGGWNYLLKDYQRQRVETFLNPESDLQGAGYHASQSIIAIGSGGLTGKGLFAGTQTQLSFLPENQTDFVFSVLAEEWGFVGCSLLILLFMALVLSMLRAVKDQNEQFAALLCVGAAAMVFWHVIINIGMVTALLPVVGVTLPFVSYGGSSMVTQVVAIAFVVNAGFWRRG